jgi:hypothetical protein
VRDRDEFFATWYLEFLRTGAQLSQNDHLKTIAKAFVAFVRHGHGTETIDEHGEFTLDDVLRESARPVRARVSRTAVDLEIESA